MSGRVQEKQIESDAKLLQLLQEGENEWKSGSQLTRLTGIGFNESHRKSLRRLELEGLVEIRQGKNRKGGLRYEYRAVTDKQNGSKG